MDVAALASAMQAYGLKQQVSLAVTKIGMDVAKQSAANMVEALEKSVNPHLGGNLDIRL